MRSRSSAPMTPPVSVALLILILGAGLCSCESAEKYRKQPGVEQRAQPVGGEVALSGTPAEIQWAKDLTEMLDAARLRYDLEDTLGAIVITDSLVWVAEGVLDTLPLEHGLADFLIIYVADAYGTLQKWMTERGYTEAASEISRRYYELADRLQARRDSAAAAAP